MSLAVLAYTQLRTKTNETRVDSDVNLLANFSSVSIGAKYYLGR